MAGALQRSTGIDDANLCNGDMAEAIAPQLRRAGISNAQFPEGV
jgi:hypothetical protein